MDNRDIGIKCRRSSAPVRGYARWLGPRRVRCLRHATEDPIKQDTTMKIMRTLSISIGAIVLTLAAEQIASAGLISSTTTVGDKTVVSFTDGDGTWTAPTGVTSIEVLVVGGGGGAGQGGGGGAGGFYYSSLYALSGSTVNVTVGAGGGGGAYQSDGTSGSTSIFDLLQAYSGQGGFRTVNGDICGMGGASGGNNQGGVGLTAANPGYGEYGSGSGAGFAGITGNSSAGGNGLTCSITGTLTYYAGGGGALVRGVGGLGGGGNGTSSSGTAASAGTANLGGGGGAGWNAAGGAGGSGVVVIAYTTVPEPSTIALLACSLVGLLAYAWKKRK